MRVSYKAVVRRLGERQVNRHLRDSTGIIHVGANEGQERDMYGRLGLPVVWVEPLSEVFLRLERNIAALPAQTAYQALITDTDGERITMHVANNGGASSSVFDFAMHDDVWPDVAYEATVSLEGVSLDTFVNRNRIDLETHDTLVIDTQGAELLVLRGGEATLRRIRQIRLEAADFEAYRGGAQLVDVDEHLMARGFDKVRAVEFARHPAGGRYYDVVYRRRPNPRVTGLA